MQTPTHSHPYSHPHTHTHNHTHKRAPCVCTGSHVERILLRSGPNFMLHIRGTRTLAKSTLCGSHRGKHLGCERLPDSSDGDELRFFRYVFDDAHPKAAVAMKFHYELVKWLVDSIDLPKLLRLGCLKPLFGCLWWDDLGRGN